MAESNNQISQGINPFTPSFGKIPPILAGRDLLVAEMERAFSSGSSDPDLCSLFIGPRGVGKTALVSYLANAVPQYGWVAANVSARSGMLEDILERAADAADQFVNNGPNVRIRSLEKGKLFGVEWEYRSPSSGNWRTRMNRLLDMLDEYGIGLLITVDEVRADVDEMIDFASTFQHFVREDRKVALLMAGLPSNVSSLVSDRSVSFLRRAASHHLGRIADHDVSAAFRETIADAGKSIGEDALSLAVDSIEGFPYLMQLVGFRSWTESGDDAEITAECVRRGSALAHDDFMNGVVRDSCTELSDMDMEFLYAMLPDEGPSSISDIASRMGKSESYVRVYRKRLETQGLISARRRGQVAFELPYLREYLEDSQG